MKPHGLHSRQVLYQDALVTRTFWPRYGMTNQRERKQYFPTLNVRSVIPLTNDQEKLGG